MKQLDLFNRDELDEAIFNQQVAKIKLNYSPLLRFRPSFQDSELYEWAVVFRKVLAELLIDLSKHKLEATDFLTNSRFRKDRYLLCELSDIKEDDLNIWVEQILDGALCFNFRILNDSIKVMLDIHKDEPPPDASLIDDWSSSTPDKNQLNLNL